MKKVLFVNGPNLNLLGKRQVHIYGKENLADITDKIKNICQNHNLSLIPYQNNIEGNIVNFLNEEFLNYQENKYHHSTNFKEQQKSTSLAGIIINPGAYSHTSIAIRDALEVFKQENVIILEVHISNIFAREEFRHHSYVSPIATGVISGLGSFGYEAALRKIIEIEENA